MISFDEAKQENNISLSNQITGSNPKKAGNSETNVASSPALNNTNFTYNNYNKGNQHQANIENNRNLKLNNQGDTQEHYELNMIEGSKIKKVFTERLGDWVCIKCKNLNFSFRNNCNRCFTSKQESILLFDIYLRKVFDEANKNESLQNQYFYTSSGNALNNNSIESIDNSQHQSSNFDNIPNSVSTTTNNKPIQNNNQLKITIEENISQCHPNSDNITNNHNRKYGEYFIEKIQNEDKDLKSHSQSYNCNYKHASLPQFSYYNQNNATIQSTNDDFYDFDLSN